MDLEKVFEHMSNIMQSEWEMAKSSVSHSGLKGSALENTFREFLQKYFTKNLQISSGIVIDGSGNESKQLDVIIHDSLKTPLMFDENEIRVIPIECVYAVIEIKANIDSSQTVDDIFENMKSVKDLEKKSFIKPAGGIREVALQYGAEWEIWPVSYYVFAIDSMKLTTIADHLTKKDRDNNRGVSKRVDCICVLNEGVIMNKLANGNYDALPEKDSVRIISLTKKPLLFFYRIISGRLFQATMPTFILDDYTKHIKF